MNFNSSMQVNMGAVQAGAYDGAANSDTAAGAAESQQYRNMEEEQQQRSEEKHDEYQMMQQIHAKTEETLKDGGRG